MGIFADLFGTVNQYFKIGITGVRLKNVAGVLNIRNTGDTADAAVTASVVNISGDSIVINSDAAGTGSDRIMAIARPTSGMSANVTFTLPATVGSPSQVLSTDGTSGNLSWTTVAGGSTNGVAHDTTSLAFGSATTVSLFALPANNEINKVRIIVDTPFNGSPSLSIGIAGTTSKYVASTQVALTESATTSFDIYPNIPVNASAENLIATYAAGGASSGAARIIVYYGLPS